MATTRREIVSECQIDVMAFFVKHRHVWGSEWNQLVKLGVQGATTLSEGPAADTDSRNPFYLGIKQCGSFVNKSLTFGNNFIWQRYFCIPSTPGNGDWTATDLSYYPNGPSLSAVQHRLYGPRCARLPHILNGFTSVNQANADGLTRGYSQDDWGVDVDLVGGLFDIRDLEQIKSRYKSVQQQNYFAQFYNDVMNEKWGTKVNTDADPRPDFLGRTTQFVSGFDVNGTDDATLGSFVGKTEDRINFKMPRKIFMEHGNLWIVALARFPLVHYDEQHPILASANPDTKLILGDPQIWQAEPVVAFDPAQWLAGGSSFSPDIDLYQQPYGQEMRYQPNRIHPNYEQLNGYPFIAWDGTSDDFNYYGANDYDDTFLSSELEHWRASMSVKVTRFTQLPKVTSSIMAGA